MTKKEKFLAGVVIFVVSWYMYLMGAVSGYLTKQNDELLTEMGFSEDESLLGKIVKKFF